MLKNTLSILSAVLLTTAFTVKAGPDSNQAIESVIPIESNQPIESASQALSAAQQTSFRAAIEQQIAQSKDPSLCFYVRPDLMTLMGNPNVGPYVGASVLTSILTSMGFEVAGSYTMPNYVSPNNAASVIFCKTFDRTASKTASNK